MYHTTVYNGFMCITDTGKLIQEIFKINAVYLCFPSSSGDESIFKKCKVIRYKYTVKLEKSELIGVYYSKYLI